MKNTAEQIKTHLMNGGVVMVSTIYQATKFDKPQHAEFFRINAKGETLMRSGKSWVCIATATMNLVSIRYGRYVAS